MTKPTRKEAEEAIRTILKYIGEDVNRSSLIETPARVIKAYDELFSGYNECKIIPKSFIKNNAYQSPISLYHMPFLSHCEHHMLPIQGHLSISYLPKDKIIGLSKIPRLVESVTKKLHMQENMTVEIVEKLESLIESNGIAILVNATHGCITMRGIKTNGNFTTMHFTGKFLSDKDLRSQFLENSRTNR